MKTVEKIKCKACGKIWDRRIIENRNYCPNCLSDLKPDELYQELRECPWCGQMHTNAYFCDDCMAKADEREFHNGTNYTPDFDSMEYKNYWR